MICSCKYDAEDFASLFGTTESTFDIMSSCAKWVSQDCLKRNQIFVNKDDHV